jgi:hypothetical protein
MPLFLIFFHSPIRRSIPHPAGIENAVFLCADARRPKVNICYYIYLSFAGMPNSNIKKMGNFWHRHLSSHLQNPGTPLAVRNRYRPGIARKSTPVAATRFPKNKSAKETEEKIDETDDCGNFDNLVDEGNCKRGRRCAPDAGDE